MYDRGTMTVIFRADSACAAAHVAWSLAVVAAVARSAGAALGRSGARLARPDLQLETLRREGAATSSTGEDGGRVELTLDPRLQEPIEEVLRDVPDPVRRRGGGVDPRRPRAGDGRPLGRRAAPGRRASWRCAPGRPPHRCSRSSRPPRWSSEGGVSGATRICYHGGVSSILPDNLVDLPLVDRRCETLAYGLGKSQNAILAKLASRHLTAAQLARVGHAFGFEETIPFDCRSSRRTWTCPPTRWSSRAPRPASGTRRCRRCTARCWRPRSPTTARCRRPTLVDRAFDARRAARSPLPVGRRPRRVVGRDAAREVGRMMELTTRIGTAKGDVPRQARPPLSAGRGRGQDRHAVGADRPRLPGLQLVRRLRARGPPRDRVCRRAGQPGAVAHQGDLRGPPHRPEHLAAQARRAGAAPPASLATR